MCCGHSGSGAYLKGACECAEIGYATLRRWVVRAEKELERVDGDREKVSEQERLFVEFFDALTRERAQVELRNVEVIQRAGAGYPVTKTTRRVDAESKVVEETTTSHAFDWRAAAWFLERSFPAHWGQRQQVEHSGGSGRGIMVVPTPVTAEEWSGVAAAHGAKLRQQIHLSGADAGSRTES